MKNGRIITTAAFDSTEYPLSEAEMRTGGYAFFQLILNERQMKACLQACFMMIDFHVHAFPDRIAAHAIAALAQNSGYDPQSDGTFSDTCAKMDAAGIDRFVLLNVAQTPAQQKNANSFVIEHNGGKVISFASLHPLAEDVLYELDRAKDAGLKGVKLHPEYQGFNMDDKEVYPFYEACAKRDMILLFHAGFDTAYPDGRRGYPDRSSKVVRDFPGAKIVLAHLGNCMDNQETLEQLCGLDCWLDLSICYKTMSAQKIKAVIDAHGADRILYGTDFPWGNIADTIAMVESLGLSDEDKEKIYHINAEKLLGL